MGELGADLSPWAASMAALQARGATLSWLARRIGEAGPVQAVALMAFSDALKPGARQAVAALQARGLRTVLITGDNRAAAQAVAAELGMAEVHAEVLPQDKAAAIEALRRGPDGRPRVVAMVGDGINDAPALAAADIGLAMANEGGGTDVALHSAGITLMRGDPALVPLALDLSARTTRKIRQNLFWAFAYNVVGIPLAAFGLLNPMLAGAAMAFSSVSVVGNALLLGRWRPTARKLGAASARSSTG